MSGTSTKAKRKPRLIGQPMSAADVPADVAAAFHARMVQGAPDECWLRSDFSINGKGYAQFMLSRKGKKQTCSAHRLAFVLLKGGTIAKGGHIRHSCSTPWCLNPAHLHLGSARDNALDTIAAGRKQVPAWWYGPTRSHRTEAHVMRIRELAMQGETINEIVRATNERRSFVEDVIAGVRWRHLGGKIERKVEYIANGEGPKQMKISVVKVHPAEPASVLPSDYNPIGMVHAPIDYRLTPANVADIKLLRSQGQPVASVARMFSVGVGLIRRIDAGALFADVPGPPPSRTGPLAFRKPSTSTAPKHDGSAA